MSLDSEHLGGLVAADGRFLPDMRKHAQSSQGLCQGLGFRVQGLGFRV